MRHNDFLASRSNMPTLTSLHGSSVKMATFIHVEWMSLSLMLFDDMIG